MTATSTARTWHANVMSVFYAAREAQDLRVEAATMGYDTEVADYYATVEPKLTFCRFLTDNRGSLSAAGA